MNDRISPGCASIHADVKRDERACSHPLHLSPPSMTNHRLERDTSGSVSRCWVRDKNNWSDVSREEVQVQFYIFFVFSQLEEEQSGGHIFGSDKKKKEGPHNFAEKDANLPFFKLHSRKKLLSEYNIAQCLPKADNFEVSEKDLVGNRR
uniref:Uncharacterized protein n=1 Tax=Onchocerca volvulus TaxID=6282 RepID=A0A8R1TTK9_ONCVO